MIHCVFTLDYEVYGNGTGSLRALVYDPAERLTEIFLRRGHRFVTFVEVAEFERIEEAGSDEAIGLVTRQIRALHERGFETGLHLHPQWYNATYQGGSWTLDYGEYNLCVLPRSRVEEIVERGLGYLRRLVGDPSFAPLSFRAGNWLFQPTQHAAAVLAEKGLRLDSSVFKGGLQRRHGLDYRPSLQNGEYWRFSADVNVPDARGPMTEVPIRVEMTPIWKMATGKRVSIHTRPAGTAYAAGGLNRLGDFMRLRYPRKLDFCRMTFEELKRMVDRLIRLDRKDPETLRPVVSIGHTKDLVDFDTVERFLDYLSSQSLPVSTFSDLYPQLSGKMAL